MSFEPSDNKLSTPSVRIRYFRSSEPTAVFHPRTRCWRLCDATLGSHHCCYRSSHSPSNLLTPKSSKRAMSQFVECLSWSVIISTKGIRWADWLISICIAQTKQTLLRQATDTLNTLANKNGINFAWKISLTSILLTTYEFCQSIESTLGRRSKTLPIMLVH